MPTRVHPQTKCQSCGAEFPNAAIIRALERGDQRGSVTIPGPPDHCPACGAATARGRARAEV